MFFNRILFSTKNEWTTDRCATTWINQTSKCNTTGAEFKEQLNNVLFYLQEIFRNGKLIMSERATISSFLWMGAEVRICKRNFGVDGNILKWDCGDSCKTL